MNSIGLYLAAAGTINPIIAAVLHNLSTLLVVFNSSRLIRFDPSGIQQDACLGKPVLAAPMHEEEKNCCA